jgi:hypothetical protein
LNLAQHQQERKGLGIKSTEPEVLGFEPGAAAAAAKKRSEGKTEAGVLGFDPGAAAEVKKNQRRQQKGVLGIEPGAGRPAELQ